MTLIRFYHLLLWTSPPAFTKTAWPTGFRGERGEHISVITGLIKFSGANLTLIPLYHVSWYVTTLYFAYQGFPQEITPISWFIAGKIYLFMGGGDKEPNTDLGIPHYAKFPYTDPLNFNRPGSIFLRNSYGNPRLILKYINGSHYGRIFRQGG